VAIYSHSCADTLSAVDVGTALEFFAETVSPTDSASADFRFVGHSGTGYGWKLRYVQEVLYQDLEAGDSWAFTLEDYLEHSTVCDLLLRLHNPEAKNLSVVVTQMFKGLGTFTLLSETFAGKAYLDLPIFPRLLSPVRQRVTITRSWHTVTITNNESEDDATASALLSGWVTWATKLPAEGPSYPPLG
jgi:hypothetical protein